VSAATEDENRASWLPKWWWDLDVRHRRYVAGGVVVVLAIIGIGAMALLRNHPVEEPEGPPSGASIFVASLPPDRVATWDSLAECESGGNWSENSGNGFYGGLQFTLDSWQGVGGSGQPNEHSREEQILRGELLEDIQGFGAWPNCAADLGLT
jgi:hypothetical protein